MKITRREILCHAAASAGLAAIPRLVAAQGSDGFIELRAGKTNLKLEPDGEAISELWTYNGLSPGPEIRVTRNQRVKVRFINELDEPSSIHWHGIRIDNSMDGVSGLTQDAVPPGGSFEYDFVAPDAGTFWYHAHNKSWDQVARGLYGPLIVADEQPAFDPDHDLSLVIDDWRIRKDGGFDVASLGSLRDWSHAGRLGNWLTVNGRSRPTFRLTAGEAYRIRLINASNARVLRLQVPIEGALAIALDGQTLVRPIPIDGKPIVLAPAQRMDLLARPQRGGQSVIAEVSGRSAFPFAEIQTLGSAKSMASAPVLKPANLPDFDLTHARRVPLLMRGGAMGQLGKVIHRGKELSRDEVFETRQVWTMNGVANLAEQPLFSAERNQTMIIEMINETVWPHAMHTHGHHFKVISRQGRPVDDGSWRDTVLIERDEKAEIAFVADNPGKWLLHCHMLEHAAAGMNTWFKVT